MSQQQRFAGLRAVLHAVSLSLSSRVVYFELDDRAGVSGHCWPRQHTISACTGISERAVRDAIAELAKHDHIQTKRGQRGMEYFLCWKYRQILPVGSGEICRSERQILPVRAGASLYEPTQEPTQRTTVCPCGDYFEGEERARCGCGRIHDPRTALEVEPLEVVREMLVAYVQKCGLAWPPPDEAICVRTLDAAGGSVVFLVSRLRFLLLNRRLAPRDSYGWFPRVCAIEGKRSA